MHYSTIKDISLIVHYRYYVHDNRFITLKEIWVMTILNTYIIEEKKGSEQVCSIKIPNNT